MPALPRLLDPSEDGEFHRPRTHPKVFDVGTGSKLIPGSTLMSREK